MTGKTDEQIIQDALKCLSDVGYGATATTALSALDRMAGEINGLRALAREVSNPVAVDALKDRCLSEIKIGGMTPQKTSQFDEHMRLTIDYLASKGLLNGSNTAEKDEWRGIITAPAEELVQVTNGARQFVAMFDEDLGEWTNGEKRDLIYRYLTHWKPLGPLPPAQEKKNEQR